MAALPSPEVVEAAVAKVPELSGDTFCLLMWCPEGHFFQMLALSAGSPSYSVRTTGSARIARLWWESVARLSLTDWGRVRLAEIAEGGG